MLRVLLRMLVVADGSNCTLLPHIHVVGYGLCAGACVAGAFVVL
jgi:hypothetical protein